MINFGEVVLLVRKIHGNHHIKTNNPHETYYIQIARAI